MLVTGDVAAVATGAPRSSTTHDPMSTDPPRRSSRSPRKPARYCPHSGSLRTSSNSVAISLTAFPGNVNAWYDM
jgi:hypothetical protein